jgi:hypothetical protein
MDNPMTFTQDTERRQTKQTHNTENYKWATYGPHQKPGCQPRFHKR